MQAKPYVGITGITELAQSEALVAIAEDIGWPRSHKLMIGALVSYKGLAFGKLANPSQYIGVDQIDEVLVGDARVLNLIHYNSRAEGQYAQLHDVVRRVRYADGLQLNIDWPGEAQLRRLRERIYTTVVLQVGSRAYKSIGARPDRLVERLRSYSGLVDYVLIDPSSGTGTPFSSDFALTTLQALVDSRLPMKWGIAGGLSPDNLAKLEPLLWLYPKLSWDAQGRLRDKQDNLDLGRCRAYLEASADSIIAASS